MHDLLDLGILHAAQLFYTVVFGCVYELCFHSMQLPQGPGRQGACMFDAPSADGLALSYPPSLINPLSCISSKPTIDQLPILCSIIIYDILCQSQALMSVYTPLQVVHEQAPAAVGARLGAAGDQGALVRDILEAQKGLQVGRDVARSPG